jgi:hypothetical protein
MLMTTGAATARIHMQTAIAWSSHECGEGSGSDDERMGSPTMLVNATGPVA